ncbi:MAG TPA: hypothetical protein VHN19_10215 [Burkholderiales bacterium]|nr:hypothetical protein [Burkholderiales bacterium]
MVKKPPELHLVRGSGPVRLRIVKFPVLCRYERPMVPGRVGRPWPTQHAWRDRVRQLARNPVKP